jgi:RNA polymerase sigma factor (sigma-70 family)
MDDFMTVLAIGLSADHIGDEPIVENVVDATLETLIEDGSSQSLWFPSPGEEPYQSPASQARSVIPHATHFPSEPTGITSLSPVLPPAIDWSLLDEICPKYIKAFVRRYENNGISTEELMDLAWDGVYKALPRFDPSKSKFQTYATWWMRERITQRFKDIKKETEYLSQFTNGMPIGSMAEDVEEVSILHSYYHEDGTIDPELEEVEIVEIPVDIADIFLNHVCSVCQDVLDGVTRMAAYQRMLSSTASERWTESDLMNRGEVYTFLEAVVKPMLRPYRAEIFLRRFGVTCSSFNEIAKGKGVTSEAIRCEFLLACEDLIKKIRSPISKHLALASFAKARTNAKKPILG